MIRERIVQALFFLLGLAAIAAAQNASQPVVVRSVHVAAVRDARPEREYFRFGVPLDRAQDVRDAADLSVMDEENRPIAAAITVTSRYGGEPGDRGKPAKWILCTLAAPAGREKMLHIVRAKPVASAATVTGAENGMMLKVGGHRLRLMDGSKAVVEEWSFDDRAVATRPFGTLVATDETGRPRDAEAWRITVETSGCAAIVRARTTIFSLEVEVLLHLVADSPEIFGTARIVHRGAYGHMETESDHRYFRSLGITMPTLDGWAKIAAGGTRGEIDRGSEVLRLDTSHTWTSKKALPSERMPFRVTLGERTLGEGDRLTGAIAFASADRTLGIGIERFWQCAPKALTIDGAETTLDIFPLGGHGPEYGGVYGDPAKPKTVDPRALSAYRFEGGRAFTQRFRCVVSSRPASAVTANLSATIDHPLSACPAEMDYGPNGPLGYPTAPRLPRRSDGARRFERLMDVLVDDGAADNQPALGRIGLPGFIERGGTYGQEAFYGWFNYGDIAWGDGYCSLHYDFPFGVLLEFLRTGDPRFFERGDIMAQHRRDIDQDHGTESKHKLRGGQFYEKGYWHGNYYFPTPSHTWLYGSILHYLLTGDEGSREVAELGREFLVRQHLERWEGLYGVRIPGWTADNFLTLWWIFGKDSDLDHAEAIIRRFEELETSKYGAKGYVMNEAMKPVSEQPWMLNIMFNPIARHALLTQKTEFRPLIDRMLKLFRTRCLKFQNGGRPTVVYRQIMPDGATEPAIHLAWPMASSLALGAYVTGDPAIADEARRLFEGVARYPQEYGEGAPSPIAFRMMNYPNAESKIYSNIALWGPLVLPLLD